MRPSAVDRTHRSVAPRGRKAVTTSDASFVDHLETGSAANSRQSPSVGSVVIEGLIGLQEYDDDASGGRNRQALQHGESILEQLDLLRRDILLGQVPVPRLRELTQIIQNRPNAYPDPRLRDVLEEIQLRAHVELAKLGKAP